MHSDKIGYALIAIGIIAAIVLYCFCHAPSWEAERSERAELKARVAELKARVAGLEAQVTKLEADSKAIGRQ